MVAARGCVGRVMGASSSRQRHIPLNQNQPPVYIPGAGRKGGQEGSGGGAHVELDGGRR